MAQNAALQPCNWSQRRSRQGRPDPTIPRLNQNPTQHTLLPQHHPLSPDPHPHPSQTPSPHEATPALNCNTPQPNGPRTTNNSTQSTAPHKRTSTTSQSFPRGGVDSNPNQPTPCRQRPKWKPAQKPTTTRPQQHPTGTYQTEAAKPDSTKEKEHKKYQSGPPGKETAGQAITQQEPPDTDQEPQEAKKLVN